MLAMIDDRTLALPLDIPEGFAPEGIENTTIKCSEVNGSKYKLIPIPFAQGQVVRINDVTVYPDNKRMEFKQLLPDESGDKIANITVEGGGGFWWLIVTAESFNE